MSEIYGYDKFSIIFSTQKVIEEDSYSFTLSVMGTLTLYVSNDGTDVRIPIVGFKFFICDVMLRDNFRF